MESLNHETKRKTQIQMGGQHHTGAWSNEDQKLVTYVQDRAKWKDVVQTAKTSN